MRRFFVLRIPMLFSCRKTCALPPIRIWKARKCRVISIEGLARAGKGEAERENTGLPSFKRVVPLFLTSSRFSDVETVGRRRANADFSKETKLESQPGPL